MTGIIGTCQQLETTNDNTPDPTIWAKSLSGVGTSDIDQTYDLGGKTTYPGGVYFNSAGTKFFVGSMMGTFDDYVIEYSLSTAWDLSTASVDANTSGHLYIGTQEGLVGGLTFADDGGKIITFGRGGSHVDRFDLSTDFDASTGSYANSSYNTSSQISNVYGGHMKNDGTELYVVGYQPDYVYHYTLSTAYDVSSASLTNSFDISAKSTVTGGIHFSSDGYAFVVIDQGSDKLHKYNLTTAWDVSTASFHSSSDSINSTDGEPSGVWFDDDWTVIYFCGRINDDIYRINIDVSQTAPGQVVGLSISAASTTQLNLSWTATSGATSYKVERSATSGSGFSQIDTSNTNSYNNTSLTAGTRYYYRVRATNSEGDGAYSTEANSYTLPNQVTGLSASAASSSQINLSWSNPTGTEEGYKVMRASSSGGSFSQIASTASTSYSNTGLSASTAYYYKVKAYTSPGGDGALSSEVNATTDAGATAPTGVSIATSSSGNYNNAVLIINNESSQQWVNENGSTFSSNNLAIDVPVNFSSPDAFEYAVNTGSNMYTLVNIYGYIRASGATSYQWAADNFSENSGGISSISNVVAQAAQDGTQVASNPAITFRANGVSGGRGNIPWADGETLSFDINASATNSNGTTNAAELTVTLTGSG